MYNEHEFLLQMENIKRKLTSTQCVYSVSSELYYFLFARQHYGQERFAWNPAYFLRYLRPETIVELFGNAVCPLNMVSVSG